MFAVRNIMDRIGWGESKVAELCKIESGEFYLTRKDRLRGARQCIYPRAMLTVSKTSTPHQFQISVSRVYEEDEANILDEDEEEDDDKLFLIDVLLEFDILEQHRRYTFSWRDAQTDDPDDRFEFVADEHMNEASRDFLELTIIRAMYERKYNKSSAGVSLEALRALAYRTKEDVGVSDETEFDVQLAADVQKLSITPNAKSSPRSVSSKSEQATIIPKSKGKAKVGPQKQDAESGSELVSEDASLRKFDVTVGDFIQPAHVTGIIQAKIVDFGRGIPFNYFIVATEDGGSILAHKITPAQAGQWDKNTLSFMWFNPSDIVSPNVHPHSEVWAFVFDDVGQFQRYHAAYSRDQAYVTATWNAYDEDVEMRSASDEEGGETDEEEVSDVLRSDSGPKDDGQQNSNLVVGHNKDRAFVVRGNKIGVFKTGHDIEYSTTMTGIKTSKGKFFNPDKVMLHDQDTSMILMNPSDPHTVYRMDLGERGEIVDEWKIHDDVSIDHMAPNSKFAPTTHTQTFVGASHNGLFRVDPRLSGSKLVDSEFKQYATKAKFSSLATTQLGKIVVALQRNAKTALPALGDPIIGVDVTADGKWVVATTKTALLVFDLTIPEGKYAGQLGFDRSFPADKKPLAKRLTLTPQHVAYMGEISFTPARFNTGPDQVEKSIVTSSGPYVIAWDFNRVKKGQKDKYEIKQYGDTVVADNFRFGDDSDIVVALANNVLMVDKKQLKKPTRESLSSPARTRAIRS
ncbi:hypothetical protein BS47DRAFT_1377366 [Hydnum rufescens UP504]|uniref:VID27 cytoplasmic protein n=1 Tax=Hydnum rufescens UP504 TaxID=1448309 RepID=A0A9P6ARZ6_9AGAM|nr:hypothetical protein BS47DRAFT_1377366 [Hydnum rufescens UP504]